MSSLRPTRTARTLSAAQETAPYADALRAHAAREPLMFMVPGHAATPTGLTAPLAELVGEQAVRMDIPVLVDGIDVGPDSPYVRATELAAEAWGARRTWFLANGSSQGNRMAVIAASALGTARAPGAVTEIVAQRSAHSSFTDGLVVTGAKPRWVLPSVDAERGINHGLSPAVLRQALESAASGAVAAVYVISPSYFGAVSDVAGLASVAHEYAVPLIVDAAWGAHFGFSEAVPDFPTTQGADVVVTSAHKMGGALGQAALLHLGEGPFAEALEPLLERAYQITQTTSASSLLLGSLDEARRSLAMGADAIETSVEIGDELREWVRGHPALGLVSDEFGAWEDIADADPLRVSIDLRGTGLTGYQVRAALANDHAVYVEIATAGAIAAFLGPGKDLDVDRFRRAMGAVMDSTIGGGSSIVASADNPAARLALPAPGPLRMTPREAFFSAAELVPASEAVGRVSADTLAAYPPGVPNIVQGEEITAEALSYLQAVAASPIGYVRGASDTKLLQFSVLE